MLTVERFFGFLPCFFEGFECTCFRIQPNGVGSMKWRRQAIRSEVIFAIEQSIDYIVNQRGVNDRTICRNSDDHIRFGSLRSLVITVEHVKEAAARKRDSTEVTVFRYGIIGGIGRCGENRLGNGSRPRGPDKDALQHGLARNVRKNLPWQTGRAHTSLDDGNDTRRYHCLSSSGKSVRGLGTSGTDMIRSALAIFAFCSSNDFSRPSILLRWLRSSRLCLIVPGTITTMPITTPRTTASKMNSANEPSTSRPKNDIVTITGFARAKITARIANASAITKVRITIRTSYLRARTYLLSIFNRYFSDWRGFMKPAPQRESAGESQIPLRGISQRIPAPSSNRGRPVRRCQRLSARLRSAS